MELENIKKTNTKKRVKIRKDFSVPQIILFLILACVLFLTLVPILLMIFISFKSNSQILGNFWGMPKPWLVANYKLAFAGIWKYIINTVLYTGVACLFIVTLSSVGGYVFAKKKFPGKEIIFMLFLAMMMVPGLLTLIPSYVLHHQLGLTNTPWAIILQHTAGGQIFGIFLCRSFMNGLPNSIFESARIDGASEFVIFRKIVIPMTTPILTTVVVMQSVGIYNDYVWPLLVIRDSAKQVVSVGLTLFSSQFGTTATGIQFAGFAISSIPLLITFIFGMKYYIQGMTQGALKM
ncbi:carbohydrate ABC transporter permease [Lederbergia citri]|uniref:Carbohydrate ABC transporter permease n=1 Tax=Lederbergia citri TaxID=2833580 RepID=A0A942TIL0_9BACI|nr:carbohydrate ABC transporter permease [Lederbergia citri]MBS4197004.1 carbohydrate ABC transporter permease [Lederbergia citri]